MWDHWVPGGSQALEKLCREWAEREKVDLTFDLITSNGGKRPVWTATPEALTRIREGAEARLGRQIDRWTIHDLRRTAATHMARLGVDEIVVERVLGHRIGGVKGVYNRYRYIDEKREALKL